MRRARSTNRANSALLAGEPSLSAEMADRSWSENSAESFRNTWHIVSGVAPQPTLSFLEHEAKASARSIATGRHDITIKGRLTTKFSDRPPVYQHAGAQRSCALLARPPAAEHFMCPGSLQRRVMRPSEGHVCRSLDSGLALLFGGTP
jgi:hypothetical protein